MNQIEKNTVKAENQLKSNEYIIFDGAENTGKRIMFLGNSITLHGVKPDIGWHNHWGMAASAKEKDYVHILESKIRETTPDAAFCICQGSRWEMSYKNGTEVYPMYESAKDFAADIIIMRLIENCPVSDFDAGIFKRELIGYLDYLTQKNKAEIILTTGFWKHPGDETIREIGKYKGWKVVELGDLGEDDSMKALGLFEHNGVANHPGDLGMARIADRIYGVLKNIL